MSLPWIFVCPSSRGIGHALTRRLLLTTSLPVLATTRSTDTSSAKESLLSGLPGAEDVAPRLTTVRCDVTDEGSIKDAAGRAAELFPPGENHLRLAFAIPGILRPEKNPKQIDAEQSLESFRVNSVGPLLLIKHFGDFLPKLATEMKTPGASQQQSNADDPVTTIPSHATWVNMSARVGSTTDNRAGGWYSYRASKAAVASISKSYDNYLAARCGDRAVAVSYHPGTVKTDLSKGFWDSVGEGKLFSTEYAVERMVDVVTGLGVKQRGRTWDWKGEEVPP